MQRIDLAKKDAKIHDLTGALRDIRRAATQAYQEEDSVEKLHDILRSIAEHSAKYTPNDYD